MKSTCFLWYKITLCVSSLCLINIYLLLPFSCSKWINIGNIISVIRYLKDMIYTSITLHNIKTKYIALHYWFKRVTINVICLYVCSTMPVLVEWIHCMLSLQATNCILTFILMVHCLIRKVSLLLWRLITYL